MTDAVATDQATPITLQPGAPLATVAAHISVAQLQADLAVRGLCMPVAPLQLDLTMAELIQRNVAGRRHLHYGGIANYLRAATLAAHPDDPTIPPLKLGGPTLKRATGYGLQRALVCGVERIVPGAGPLLDVTLQLRPLPAARLEILLACIDLAQACALAARLATTRLAITALALLNAIAQPELCPTEALLLVELEGLPALLECQQAELIALLPVGVTLHQHHTYTPGSDSPTTSFWQPWERLATTHQLLPGLPALSDLNVVLPRAALAAFARHASTIAQHYQTQLALWGDVGIGTLTLACAAPDLSAAEREQLWMLLTHQAERRGGRLAASPEPPAAPVQPILKSVSSGEPAILQLQHLADLVGTENVLTRPADLLTYTGDASIAHGAALPLAVVLPTSTSMIATVMQVAAAAGLSIVTRGAGSGLAGGAIPQGGELVVSLTRMQQITLDPLQQVAHVEAGATTAAIQQAATAAGLLYAPDPSSQSVSTIGGNIACNAGGARCLKYGVTANAVLGLTVVLADGTVWQLGDSLNGQTADAGLVQLLVGSEGTLAIITEAQLQLIRPPAERRTTLAIFDRLEDACTTVETIIAAGLLPASLELLDQTSLRVVEAAFNLGLPSDAAALLLLLTDGEPEAVAWETAELARHARQGGARTVQVAQSASDEAAFWQARRSVSPAFARIRPNKLGEDICVPLPQIAHTVQRINQIARDYRLTIPVFGHAGDGNLHPNVLFDARDPDETARAWQAAEAIFAAALEAGGTLSGEHGIGTLKQPFLRAAIGDTVFALHQHIKASFDPMGRLNPGKVVTQ